MNVVRHILRGQYSKKEQQVLLLFFVSIFLGIVIHYLAKLSGAIMVLTVFASFSSGFAGIFLYFSNFRANKYTKWLVILLFYFLVVGISYGNFNPHFRGGDFNWIINQDLRFVMYVIIASILATNRFIAIYHHIMRFLAVWAIILGIIGVLSTSFSVKAVLERETTWNFGYYSWWLSASICHYWGFYSIIQKKEKYLGYLVLLTYSILGILFLKRAVVINVVFIVVFANFLAVKKNLLIYSFRIAGLVLLFFSAIWLLDLLEVRQVGLAVKELEKRFTEIKDLDDFDRQKEWVAYYQTATEKQLLLGNGIGHYPTLNIFGWDRGKLNAMHIGYYNILFKGGILLVIFYFLLFIGVLKRSFWLSRLTLFEKVCLGVAISLFVSMFFEGSWGYTLIPLGVYPSIFFLLRSKENLSLANKEIKKL